MMIRQIAPYLDTDTMTLKNTTLQQSVQEQLDFFSQFSLETGINYKLIRQNDVTVGGNIGLKIEYTSGIFYWLEVFTVADGKLFTLVYKDLPLKVPTTLPLANKMVESFQITG